MQQIKHCKSQEEFECNHGKTYESHQLELAFEIMPNGERERERDVSRSSSISEKY